MIDLMQYLHQIYHLSGLPRIDVSVLNAQFGLSYLG
jgi:hypothetical protein